MGRSQDRFILIYRPIWVLRMKSAKSVISFLLAGKHGTTSSPATILSQHRTSNECLRPSPKHICSSPLRPVAAAVALDPLAKSLRSKRFEEGARPPLLRRQRTPPSSLPPQVFFVGSLVKFNVLMEETGQLMFLLILTQGSDHLTCLCYVPHSLPLDCPGCFTSVNCLLVCWLL